MLTARLSRSIHDYIITCIGCSKPLSSSRMHPLLDDLQREETYSRFHHLPHLIWLVKNILNESFQVWRRFAWSLRKDDTHASSHRWIAYASNAELISHRADDNTQAARPLTDVLDASLVYVFWMFFVSTSLQEKLNHLSRLIDDHDARTRFSHGQFHIC